MNLFSNCLYIDPAATSALLSSITAILVALGASFIVLWRKFKKKVDKTFKIDPNKNKEVEADVVVTDEELAEKPTEQVNKEQSAAEQSAEKPAEKPAEQKATKKSATKKQDK